MDIRAVAKDTGISTQKMRPLVDMVRGRKVEEALVILRLTPSPNARVVAKLVKSAASSAENNYQIEPSELRIVRIFADNAPTLKRYRPSARGRVSRVSRRSSHITVVVSEQED